MSQGRPVVLITAFACDPRLPSEPTIGWEYLRTWLRIAAEHDLDVVAVMNERSRAATTDALRSEGADTSRLELVSPAEPRWSRILGHHRLTRLEHVAWGLRTPAAVRNTIDVDRIVLARHVTFASELLPAPITWLTGRSFTVWGPVGSTGRADAYLYAPRPRDWLLRYLVQRLRDRLSAIAARRTGRRVGLSLVTSAALADQLRAAGASVRVFPNTRPIIVDAPGEPTTRRETAHAGIAILSVGNLVPLKRIELTIAALATTELADARLRVAGKPAPGRENHLADLARRLGVAERVEFLGQVPREDVIREMHRADVLVHLSAREGGSGVVGEATSVGLPVVVFEGTGAAAVLEYAGAPGVMVPRTRLRSTRSIAEAIVEAAAQPRRRSDVWTPDRLLDAERALLRESLERTAR
ncbi:glycosyltransferase [Curtobacterium sp. MCLR17_036]|uniref:glycosyltransferase n=1 Tax=Curtobacterium sp. MCLR17_036 TaxID=2175620 RepID=UPI000DAABF61|nr:glycosyltransferase [Curtobacterium sp. MCLR17_036]WIE65412.1 glycosyltransferase [Curtobacterium sp. MCLR17_036]